MDFNSDKWQINGNSPFLSSIYKKKSGTNIVFMPFSLVAEEGFEPTTFGL